MRLLLELQFLEMAKSSNLLSNIVDSCHESDLFLQFRFNYCTIYEYETKHSCSSLPYFGSPGFFLSYNICSLS